MLEGTVSTVGIAVLSVCYDENTEDSDNEPTTTAYKAIQFTENIDKVRTSCHVFHFSNLQEMKATIKKLN